MQPDKLKQTEKQNNIVIFYLRFTKDTQSREAHAKPAASFCDPLQSWERRLFFLVVSEEREKRNDLQDRASTANSEELWLMCDPGAHCTLGMEEPQTSTQRL